MNLLIIDDNADICSCIEKALTENFNNIKKAHCYQSAREILKTTSFSHIILDYKLGETNSLGLLEEQELLGLSDSWIVFMTGFATKEIVIEATNLGVDKIIEKPFLLDELKELVNINSHELFKIIFSRNEVLYKGSRIKLTPTELRLLDILIKSSEKIISKKDLEVRLFSGETKVKNNLTTHLSNLKIKIPDLSMHLKNVRGRGYLFSLKS